MSSESVIAAGALDLDHETARSLAWLCAETEHKRTTPPTPGIAGRRVESGPQ